MHTVHSVAQCERIMETGWKNRSVGYTLMNKDSSRSHSIFTISIEFQRGVLKHRCPAARTLSTSETAVSRGRLRFLNGGWERTSH